MVSGWLRSPKLRRGVAVASLVLATGGLVLHRGSSSAAPLAGVSVTLSGGKNAASFSGPRAKGRLALSHGKVLAGETTRVYAELDLAALAGSDDVERAPLSMAVVLDTSGSMSGDKIADAKRSVVQLIREMRDDDELTIIEYSDHSRVVEPLQRVGAARSRLISAVQGLSAGGGTNIPSGLRAALGELGAASQGRVRRVVLASDGLDSSRAQAQALARRSFGDGTTISSLGIGLDFDESYMSSLAVAGHGNFAFVDDKSSLGTFLSRELREASTTTLEAASVRLHLPTGVRFVAAHGADARVGEGTVDLTLGSLFAGDQRRVVVELDVDLEAGDARGLRAEAEWSLARCGNGECQARVSVPALSISGTGSADEVASARDNAVVASAVSVTASQRQIEAAEAWSKGDTTTARRIADGNVTALKAALAAAPPEERGGLADQIKSYEAASGEIAAAPAASPRARAAAKSMMQKDVANSARKAF
jgi:Ca-activated chloride channel homolog